MDTRYGYVDTPKPKKLGYGYGNNKIYFLFLLLNLVIIKNYLNDTLTWAVKIIFQEKS